MGKIHVFDAQTEAFHETQAAAIEQLADELVNAGQTGDNLLGFSGGEDGGQFFGFVGPGHVDGANFLVKNVAVKKKEGGKGLVLGGGGNVVIGGQVGQKGFDFSRAHVGGVAFIMEKDEAPDPTDVSFFGAQGILVEAGAFTGLIEQLFGGR